MIYQRFWNFLGHRLLEFLWDDLSTEVDELPRDDKSLINAREDQLPSNIACLLARLFLSLPLQVQKCCRRGLNPWHTMRACAVFIPAGLASRWAKFLSTVVTQKPWGRWSVCHLLKIASALLIPHRSIQDVQVYLHSHTLSEHLPKRSRLQVPQRTRLYDHPWLEDFQSQDTWQNHQNKEKSRKVLRWFSVLFNNYILLKLFLFF